ncbi:MAG: hypothetical protein QNI92_12245 [Desulfobacterales bacterium]|nr:hypothetical protein [Desulfobacterales bacterium]MDJ0912444.1 hypothetical protein [Desulfobacterales bacterium]
MKTKLTVALIVLILATFATLPIPDPADAQGVEMAGAKVVMGKVVAVDDATRAMTLQGPMGEVMTIIIPPTDPHFDQIEVGDQVKIEYHESVALYIGKPGEATATAGAITGTSPKGTQPKAVVARAVDVSAKVVAIDKPSRGLTLELTDGRQVTTRVDESLPGFETIRVGDTIHARITEAVALSLEKQ